MASAYPTGYDSMSSPGSTLAGPPLHSDIHTQVGDAIEAMQAEMGLSPSGSSASIAARLDRSLPTCRLFDAEQNISANTTAVILYDTEPIDTDGIHSTSVNKGRMTVPTGLAGRWLVGVYASFDELCPGGNLKLNGADTYFIVPVQSVGGGCLFALTIPLTLADGDYLEFAVTAPVGTSTEGPLYSGDTFWMTRLGPT